MLFNVDHSTGRCERCQRLLDPRFSYITASYTRPEDRHKADPPVMVLARQCFECHAGRCAATLDNIESPCDRPRRRGSATCKPCAERITKSMKLTLWKYGITKELEPCEIK